MRREALIADNAAGNPDTVSGVLARFGFGPPTTAGDREAAIASMQDSHFDLIVLPLDQVTPPELLAVERAIRKDPGTTVIGTSPSADPNLILRAMRAGVHEFLVYPPSPEELAASVERLMRRNAPDLGQGELVAVYSSKGGLGTTSIAVNLAQAFAGNRSDARVALADLVVAGGDVRVFLNLKPLYDLSHLVAKGDKVDSELLNSLLTACPGGVWALPTGESPELDELFDSTAIASILNVLRTHFAVTVVDTEHHISERTLTALDAADRVLLVTQLTVPALRSTQRTLTICRRLGYEDTKLCVVVNRYQSDDVLPIKAAEDLLKAPIFWKLPNDYRLSAAAMTKGVPVGIEDPTSRLAKSYADLAKKLRSGHAVSGSNGQAHGGWAAQTGKSRLRKLFGIEKGAKHGT
jgi:pilus assembly protein CpaE